MVEANRAGQKLSFDVPINAQINDDNGIDEDTDNDAPMTPRRTVPTGNIFPATPTNKAKDKKWRKARKALQDRFLPNKVVPLNVNAPSSEEIADNKLVKSRSPTTKSKRTKQKGNVI